ncbi:MAG TPA: tRNA dihydrouridine synthase DusB [Desulfuromonadales bacterium]
MQIGHLKLANNVILAPMAGITDLPYRRIMKGFGAGLVFTEMVSANGLIRAGRRTRELLRSVDEERPLGIQLFGEDPAILARAAELVHDDGELLDLNLGCPVNKVVRSGAGSALLRDPAKVGRIVAAVRRATDLPLSVKIRSGWDHGSSNFLEIGRIAVDEGAEAVALHPRPRSQGFSGHADWEQIGRLKSALPVPVIGSGDIFTAADALAMFEETGCDAVMIGRGGYGNPWLIREILTLQQGGVAIPPTPGERLDVALRHLDLFLETFGEARAARDMRKHLCWYCRGLAGAATFRSAVNHAHSAADLRRLAEEYFTAAASSPEAGGEL